MSRGSSQYLQDDPSQNNRRRGPAHQQPRQWQSYVPYPPTLADPSQPPPPPSTNNYPTSPTTYAFQGYLSHTYTPPHNYGSFQGPMPGFDPNSAAMIAQGSAYPPYNQQPEQSPASPPLYQTGPASNPTPQTSPTLNRPPRLQQAHSQPAYQGVLFQTPATSTFNYQSYAPSPYQQSFPLGPFQQPMQSPYQPQPTYPTFMPTDSDSGQQQQSQASVQLPLQQQGGWWYHPPPPHTAPALAQIQSPFAMGYGGFMSPPPQDLGFPMMQAISPGGQPFFAQPPTGRASPGPGMNRTYSLPVTSGPSGTTDPSRPAPSRKSYHPRAPQNRSEWVMWAGNVPADATQEELWALFTRPPSPVPSNNVPPAFGDDNPGGVTSLHLIARSNCAFVNFNSHEALLAAVRRFDGRPARTEDPRCPRLVCRVRRREDDLRAGVGAQRGTGVHSKWVKDNVPAEDRGKGARSQGVADIEGRIGALSISGPSAQPDQHAPGRARHQSSGSDSYASTNSSLLGQHFPRRFFILKSLSQSDLELSVETGLWATQAHNEEVLDRAWRTATDVYLIFGVNKSGEFFGYARMAGPIRGERRVSWASTTSSQAIPPSGEVNDEDDGNNAALASSGAVKSNEDEPPMLFSPSEHRMASSPQPLSSRGITNGLDPGGMGGLLGAAGAALDRAHLIVRQHTATEPNPLSPNPSASQSSIASAPAATEMGSVRPIIPTESDEDMTPPASGPVDVLGEAERAAGEVMPPHATVKDILHANAPVINLDHHAPLAARAAGRMTTPALHPIREVITPPEEEPRRKSAPADIPELEITGIDDTSSGAEDSSGVKRLDTLELEQRRGSEPGTAPQLDSVTSPSGAGPSSVGNPWGSSFKVEWIKTERLPFWRTRNLRNPWNQDREVKVSRDGTELEPSVGQRLLDEWDAPAPPAPPISPQASRRSRTPAAQAINRTPAPKPPVLSNSGGPAPPSAAILGPPLRRPDTRPP